MSTYLPATQTAQIIDFTDRPLLTLSIYNGQVMLDDQVVSTTAVSIDGGSEVIGECGAYVAPGVWKEFDCYNLAAIGKTTGDDPFTPSWRLIGGYWQWGRKGPDSSQWYDTNTPNFAHGPTGPDAVYANDGEISGWDNTSYADNGAWSDLEKTANDPCPSGYRVPTQSQWQGVVENNIQITVGTWSDDDTNYSSGRFFGDDLILPAAGLRNNYSASLISRGNYGLYWSSTEYSGNSNSAWYLDFRSSYAYTDGYNRGLGFSVRCIEDDGSSEVIGECGAYVAPGVWKEFDCYNLAAIGKTTNDDPFTPSWRLIGGYWQWGRKGPDSSQWYNTNTANFAHGPTGPDAVYANDGEISGWDTSYADNGAWSDSEKTANDPCPSGYRVPTQSQWQGVVENNIQITVGTWSDDDTNYSSGRFFGDNLILPAAGNLYDYNGSLFSRGDHGYYWSSTEYSGRSSIAWNLCVYSSGAISMAYSTRSYGFSVRCIAE
ncbi:MAG: FISUMP domain-containing protein [Desulfobacter sp.]